MNLIPETPVKPGDRRITANDVMTASCVVLLSVLAFLAKSTFERVDQIPHDLMSRNETQIELLAIKARLADIELRQTSLAQKISDTDMTLARIEERTKTK